MTLYKIFNSREHPSHFQLMNKMSYPELTFNLGPEAFCPTRSHFSVRSSDHCHKAQYFTFDNPFCPFFPHHPYTLTMAEPVIISHSSSKRVRFTLFTKILFKHLQESDDKSLFYEAQAIVRQTIHLHRSNEHIFPPLFQVVELQLRELVGETRWRHAHKLMRFYLTKKDRFAKPAPKRITIGSMAA